MMASTDILVIGAGPAGLNAALAASESGRQVLLLDDNPAAGGQIWRGGREPAAQILWQALELRSNVRCVFGVRVVARAGANSLLLDTPDGPQTLHWQSLILCSGARELLLPFPGWTLPGVTGAGGLQAMVKAGLPLAGKRVVVAGSGPLLLAVADTVRRSGGQLLAIAEHRTSFELARFAGRLALSQRAKLWQSFGLMRSLAGVPYLHGVTPLRAEGEHRLRSVVLNHRGQQRQFDCDYLACGFGLLPNPELAAMLGCALDQGKVVADGDQRTSRLDVWAAGESTGIGGVDKAEAEGRIAGRAACGRQPTGAELEKRRRAAAFGTLLAASFAPPAALREMCCPGTIVCRCEDVRSGQLAAYGDWRSAKLQTRVGMGACQGRVCGAACEFLYGWQARGLRQPVFPTSAATLAACAKDEK